MIARKSSPLRERIVEVIEFDTGKYRATLSEWAKEYDLPISLVYDRYNGGLRGQDLIAPRLNDIISDKDLKKLWGKWSYTGKSKIVKPKYYRGVYRWVYVGIK